MLEGSADANGEIDFRFYRLSGNAHLSLFWQPVSIHHGPAARNRSAQVLCQFFKQWNMFRSSDPLADRDENLCLGDILSRNRGFNIFDKFLDIDGPLERRRFHNDPAFFLTGHFGAESPWPDGDDVPFR